MVRISLRRPPGSCQNRKPPAKLTIFFRGFRAGFSTCTGERINMSSSHRGCNFWMVWCADQRLLQHLALASALRRRRRRPLSERQVSRTLGDTVVMYKRLETTCVMYASAVTGSAVHGVGVINRPTSTRGAIHMLLDTSIGSRALCK